VKLLAADLQISGVLVSLLDPAISVAHMRIITGPLCVFRGLGRAPVPEAFCDLPTSLNQYARLRYRTIEEALDHFKRPLTKSPKEHRIKDICCEGFLIA